MIPPLFSICIPTFNRKEKLLRAIYSALEQDYVNIEVVVSDNNSTDGTEQLVLSEFKNEAKVKYFRNNQNVGMVPNWRLCIERAKGKYYIILDDDNYLIYNKYVSEAIDLLIKENNLMIVFGNFLIRFPQFDQIVKYNLPEINNGINIYSNYFNYKKIPQIFFTVLNREFALANDFYKENIITHDVQSFLISMLAGNVGYMNRVVGIYDMTGDDNVVHSIGLKWKDYVVYNQKVIKFAKNKNIRASVYMKPFKRQMIKSYNYFLLKANDNDEYVWLDKQIKKTYSISFRIILKVSAVFYKPYKYFKNVFIS